MKYRCETKELAIGYGGAPLASGITLGAVPGQILALIGPNGAGKNHCFQLCHRYLPATFGSVSFNGEVILADTPQGKMRRLYEAI